MAMSISEKMPGQPKISMMTMHSPITLGISPLKTSMCPRLFGTTLEYVILPPPKTPHGASMEAINLALFLHPQSLP